MHLSPSVLGAVAAVLVTGAACGAELGTVPSTKRVGLAEILPPAHTTQVAWNAPRGQAAQDHYPIVTPEGRFEVSQLSDRGLYRAERYAAAMAFSRTVNAPPAPPPQPPRASVTEPAPDRQVVIYDTSDRPNADIQADPEVAEAASPRVIDVAAELAARQGAGPSAQ